MKKIKIKISKGAKGFYFSVIAANGKNLNPADPQKKKKSVTNAINSLLIRIEAGHYEIIDTTKK